MSNNIVQQLKNENKLLIPDHLLNNIQYLVYVGSHAYGVNTETSDYDIHGFTIPNQEDIYPYMHKNIIYGFDDPPDVFHQFTKHHIDDKYDVTIYSIVKFFYLLLKNNPMTIESLFVKEDKIIQMTEIGKFVRENRSSFLNRGFIYSFAGFAYSQLYKMGTKNPIGKRKENLINGVDYKFAYHAVRLLLEMEQLTTTGTMDLEKDKLFLMDIRTGKYSREWIMQYAKQKLDTLNNNKNSVLRDKPNKDNIRALLNQCLYLHSPKCKYLQPDWKNT